MAGILLPHRLRQQPQAPALDLAHPLMRRVNDVYVGGQMVGLVRGIDVGVVSVGGTPSIRAGSRGVAFTVPGANASGFNIGNSVAMGLGAECTVFIYRRSFDTTGRSAQVFGHPNTVSDRCLIAAPLNDGLCYWDYGNATAGSGRLTVAFTKNTSVPDALVFVAGAVKGREIWRNGVRLANNTSATYAPTFGSYQLSIGSSNAVLSSDNEEIYMLGIVNRAWSDSEIAEWSQNPWGIFKQRGKPWVAQPSAAVGAGARPQVFVCT